MQLYSCSAFAGTAQQKRPFSVKVSNLAPTVDEERLQDLLGEYSSEVTVFLRQSSSDDSSELNYAWLNCPSCDVADAVVEKVNGKVLDDVQVKAMKKPGVCICMGMCVCVHMCLRARVCVCMYV